MWKNCNEKLNERYSLLDTLYSPLSILLSSQNCDQRTRCSRSNRLIWTDRTRCYPLLQCQSRFFVLRASTSVVSSSVVSILIVVDPTPYSMYHLATCWINTVECCLDFLSTRDVAREVLMWWLTRTCALWRSDRRSALIERPWLRNWASFFFLSRIISSDFDIAKPYLRLRLNIALGVRGAYSPHARSRSRLAPTQTTVWRFM